MNIEQRMNEFRKTGTTKEGSPVENRMDEFHKPEPSKVTKSSSQSASSSPLPYGLKSHKPCPFCSGILDLQEVKANEALYLCQDCKREISFPIA